MVAVLVARDIFLGNMCNLGTCVTLETKVILAIYTTPTIWTNGNSSWCNEILRTAWLPGACFCNNDDLGNAGCFGQRYFTLVLTYFVFFRLTMALAMQYKVRILKHFMGAENIFFCSKLYLFKHTCIFRILKHTSCLSRRLALLHSVQ